MWRRREWSSLARAGGGKVMRAKRWQRYVLVGTVLASGAMRLVADGAHAQSTPRKDGASPDARRAMQADLRIRQMQVGADGRAVGVASPGLVLHLDRRAAGGRLEMGATL